MPDLHGTDAKKQFGSCKQPTEGKRSQNTGSVQDFVSPRSTDGDGHDEHRECEIDINAVGRAEEGGGGGPE